MKSLTPQWREYARLQSELARKTSLGDSCWALEAAMDSLIEGEAEGQPFVAGSVTRVFSSAVRRHKYRAGLRGLYLAHGESAADPTECIEARSQLGLIQRMTSRSDWRLLCQVGEGVAFSEIAEALNITTTALRIRTFRLRKVLMAA